MTDVFISYSRKDKEFVQILNRALVESKYDAWVDWEDIPLTADWWAEIQAGIEAADTFIFIISPHSIASTVCRQEIDHAIEHNKRLVPIVRQEGFDMASVHPAISRTNWLFFQEEHDFKLAFQSLVNTLNTDLVHIKAHTRLLVRALEWEKKHRQDDYLLRGGDLAEAERWLTEAWQEDHTPLPTQQHQTYITKSAEVEAANGRLVAAGERAKHMVRFGSIVLGVTLCVATAVSILTIQASRKLQKANLKLEEAKVATYLERESNYALSKFETAPLDALLSAMENGLELKALVDDNRPLEDYPTTQPLVVLKTILDNIQERNKVNAHTSTVWSMDVSDDGSLDDATVRLWNREGKEIAMLRDSSRLVSSAVFHPNGQALLVTAFDPVARLWDLSSHLTVELKGHEDVIWDSDISPDGETMVTGGNDGVMRLWTKSGTLIANVQGHQDAIWAIKFSHDGKAIATASDDGTTRLWGSTGTLLTELRGHKEGVTSVNFSPDDRYVVTAAGDGTIRLWNRLGQQLAEFRDDQGTGAIVSFDAEGNRIIAVSQTGTVRMLPVEHLSLAEVLDRGCEWLQDYLARPALHPREQVLCELSP
ncbi:WD-40 repeat protein [Halomicronema hongdechloris C2206]|uniref:WD-40 repeat protein n=1 Tax=Halomicronema hongdechloris C2206 TaxID=1641165 RepID=A0A1Z3HGX3_9CYAN|nr:TIR domain-containing protein [Halomicronema hongdechloris]ASC69520.1 WD-40 repeat protein [Halomicronema hongdechloris C2206]